MTKLVISDLDGTLLDSDEAIPMSTMVAIDNIRRKKIIFAVATGRMLSSILDYNKDFPFIDYAIACNGSYVYDVNKKKEIFASPIPDTIVKDLYRHYSNNIMYFVTKNRWNLVGDPAEIRGHEKPIADFTEFCEKNSNGVYKIEICIPTKKIETEITTKLKNLPITVTTNYYQNLYVIEITNKNVTKYTGVAELLKYLKVPKEEVLVIGDANNDLAMIKKLPNSIAVANASKDVLKYAKRITSSNNDKGVENILKELI
jgi:Cof subfamily protein (haloacid dehalogenase superfamily)